MVPTHEDPTDFLGMFWDMAYAMREQAATVHKMMDQLERQHEAGHGGNPNGPEVDLEYLKFAEFRKV